MAKSDASRKWYVLIGVCLLGYVGFLDSSIVNTILPGIQRDLTASIGQLQWIMTGFLMMLSMFMVTMGRFGDIYGCRKVLYIGVLIFAGASLGAGLSWDPRILIAFRIVQGIACGITFTCSAALITHVWPENERGRALGLYAAITGSGLAAEPVPGGLLLSVLSWRCSTCRASVASPPTSSASCC